MLSCLEFAKSPGDWQWRCRTFRLRRTAACVQTSSSCRSSNVAPQPPRIRAPPTQADPAPRQAPPDPAPAASPGNISTLSYEPRPSRPLEKAADRISSEAVPARSQAQCQNGRACPRRASPSPPMTRPGSRPMRGQSPLLESLGRNRAARAALYT
jgi:hypothetical protein